MGLSLLRVVALGLAWGLAGPASAFVRRGGGGNPRGVRRPWRRFAAPAPDSGDGPGVNPNNLFVKIAPASSAPTPSTAAEPSVVWGDDEAEMDPDNGPIPRGNPNVDVNAETLPDYFREDFDEEYFLDDDAEVVEGDDIDVTQLRSAAVDAPPEPQPSSVPPPTFPSGVDDEAGPDPEQPVKKKKGMTDEALVFDNEVLITREQGWLGDSRLCDIAEDYGFPLDFVFEALTKWGVPPPILPEARLGDLVTADQAFALLEALNTLDRSDVHDDYIEETLDELAEEYGVGIGEIFQACGENRLNLSNGMRTRLSVGEFKTLCKAMGWPIPEAYEGR
eukprot:CAMPEP_0118877012 /NCGR_PEP_ID=MMETSP1163-20130328/17473_1 /TAXON_ID=124430 /ORGANISM="Phaeomonas parva, Strain CCMP2877" /LENGTH=333 /DNA_ID=CAMNT_0006812679 /DNA_START=192 /DNA_END=1193 /DNA_ORIENTATION=+